MSTIAAMLLLLVAASAAAAPPLTAEQVLARNRAMTSIGADPCRNRAEDEIVVCGKLVSPYSLALSGAMEGAASQYGGNRAGQMADVQAASSPCAMQLSTCRPRAAFNAGKALEVLVKVVKALTDGE